MEGVDIMNERFWRGKRVLITGHTGFKGGWLSLWLTLKGADVVGFALEPPTQPSFFYTCSLAERMQSVVGDVRDAGALQAVFSQAEPEIVIHMAAQALVRTSYENPVETYATNVMGTVNVLEAVRRCSCVKSVLVITSDKCYENNEWYWGYREIDPLGGHDPYASSKGCAELVTSSYRQSFFPPALYHEHGVAVASARAGNVIGGGDWARDRLVPDVFRAVEAGRNVSVRYPRAIRPWQHVLEPLNGYLCLVERLYDTADAAHFSEAWNFGPADDNCQPVENLLTGLAHCLEGRLDWSQDQGDPPHEATYLKLDCSKAHSRLGWTPKLDLATTLSWTAAWYDAFYKGEDVVSLSIRQIEQFEEM